MIIIDFLLTMCFTVFTLTIVYLILNSHINFTTATISGTMLVVLATFTYWSINTYHGYPSREPILNKKYELIYGEAHKPTDIYLWLYETTREDTELEKAAGISFKRVPRAYRIPYSEESAKKLREALEKKDKEGYGIDIKVNKVDDFIQGEDNQIDLEVQFVNPIEYLPKN